MWDFCYQVIKAAAILYVSFILWGLAMSLRYQIRKPRKVLAQPQVPLPAQNEDPVKLSA